MNEIAEKLGILPSIAAPNVKTLEDSGLILTKFQWHKLSIMEQKSNKGDEKGAEYC
ncbi:MAG: hypothetical protein LBK00_02695 [Treponema sp.]|jgi:predicted transcriptional regulator|nr:hypothetical protein [Treponema sp.]